MSGDATNLTTQALLVPSGVTALVSDRIMPDQLKIGTILPAIAVAISGEDEELLLSGSSQYPDSSVLIHCVGRTTTEAINVAKAVKARLRDLLFVSSDSPPVYASFRKNGVEFPDNASDKSTFVRAVGYDLRWR